MIPPAADAATSRAVNSCRKHGPKVTPAAEPARAGALHNGLLDAGLVQTRARISPDNHAVSAVKAHPIKLCWRPEPNTKPRTRSERFTLRFDRDETRPWTEAWH